MISTTMIMASIKSLFDSKNTFYHTFLTYCFKYEIKSILWKIDSKYHIEYYEVFQCHRSSEVLKDAAVTYEMEMMAYKSIQYFVRVTFCYFHPFKF